jgi:DNA-binding protein HU-beta
LNNKELQATLASKLDKLSDNKSVSIHGFGTFEVRKKNERLTVNPLTKERSIVPAKQALAFKPSTVYKDKVKELPRHE